MFDRIVVPFEDPGVLEKVLPALSRVIGPCESEIVLVTTSEAAADLPTKCIQDPSRVTLLRRRGPLVEEILGIVDSADASLVALPSDGRTGSVAERVIRSCPRPVLAIRTDVEPRDIHTVLLPIDGGLDWKASAACAADVARRHEASVVVLRATSCAEREGAERQAHELCGELVSAGVVAYAFVEEGPPAGEILRSGAAHEADLIVMATHARHGLARLRLGGVTEEVLREARVPVMAVPAAMASAWVPAQAVADE